MCTHTYDTRADTLAHAPQNSQQVSPREIKGSFELDGKYFSLSYALYDANAPGIGTAQFSFQ